jgi:hypothetical protein
MDALMAVRVKEHSVAHRVWAPFTSPEHMVGLPASGFGDFLLAQSAEAVLVFPEVEKPLLAPVGAIGESI